MKRPLKYHASSIVGAQCGRDSHAYRLVYALEQWAARHGYDGHHAHMVPTKRDKIKQQKIRF